MRGLRCFTYMLAAAALWTAGCRANPANLAMMVVGDAIDDADVRSKQEDLIGQDALTADEVLGIRRETLRDTQQKGRELWLYLVEDDRSGATRYVVEIEDGMVVALSKTIHNIDGVGDALRESDLKAKLLGQDPETCQREGKFSDPVAILRSVEKRQKLRVYDVRDWSNLRGARYCVLRFDQRDRCRQVKLVGVSGSTKKTPPRG